MSCVYLLGRNICLRKIRLMPVIILIFVFIFGLSLEYKTGTKTTKITFTKQIV